MRIPETLGPGTFGFAGAVLAAALAWTAPAAADDRRVDVELVLAVDISYSMDEEEQRLQRSGYVEAITSPEVMNAIRQGPLQRIAVSYVEWAGAAEQRLIADWTLIDGPESARAFARKLEEQPIRRAYRTSISGALVFSTPLFDRNPWQGTRQVIDVSGDGANNQGILVEEARDEALKRGIVINGLPILIKRPNFGGMDVAELDRYYEDCVIGGEGAFMVPIRSREEFGKAIRMKLIMEIADLGPRAPLPAPAAPGPRRDTRAEPVTLKQNPLCTAGERMWQERMDWMRN